MITNFERPLPSPPPPPYPATPRNHHQGNMYIHPELANRVFPICFLIRNMLNCLQIPVKLSSFHVQQIALDSKVAIIAAHGRSILGRKGQGKSFQTELIFQTMGVEPVIMSAGELESERAGEPGKLIRERYRNCFPSVQNQGKMSCLMINDIDAGLVDLIVVGTLMNLSDNPTRVSIGQDWRESDITNRVPIIPNREDIVNIVHRMYEKDGISRDEVVSIVNRFPNQALDFYGALRSRTYDRSISKVLKILVNNFSGEKKDEKLPVFTPPEQTLEALLESGYSLIREQQLIMETKLSREYMKNIDD
ncbi:ribulose bisphosphate carboxylase/oxygenase activase [Salix suchowensis]|nr:ribulose bisphosphate carboxylase/oxygenase activase [Salix suchowensis]